MPTSETSLKELLPPCEVCGQDAGQHYSVAIADPGLIITGHQLCVTREATRYDICTCGDYRHQHDDVGCELNHMGHGGAPDCHGFRLSNSALLSQDQSDAST